MLNKQPDATIPQSTDSNAEVFEAGEETHTLWLEQVGDDTVVMVATDPLTVPQRLGKWQKEAAKMQPSGLKTNILEWIQKCWAKSQLLKDAAEIEDRKEREGKVHNYAVELKEMLKKLFWAFKIDLPELGAVAVYRGLHFTKDWEAKRGRTVQAESERTFQSVHAEGTYSNATWELAKGIAGKGAVSTFHLEAANRIVEKVLEKWKATTDFTREDATRTGATMVAARANIPRAIIRFAVQDPTRVPGLQDLLDKQKQGFTQSGTQFENQFAAALSRYIDSQSKFEEEVAAKSEGGYKDVPFKSIPFISTTKVAGEAVKYAQGKLASDENRSTAGTVGRILVYVAHRVDFLEAGGIDVWEKLGEGKLRFTEWRMNENEITFAGKMPDHFLRAMTPVDGGEEVDTAANRAEVAASKAAAPFGGLKPLPKNKAQT
ncbi:MAG TPA: hypothetical protein VNG71_12555 [Pyrinomonadaceae bacterium]|nr:hypothetical protein [Pyrinomonadaceae bacterium]